MTTRNRHAQAAARVVTRMRVLLVLLVLLLAGCSKPGAEETPRDGYVSPTAPRDAPPAGPMMMGVSLSPKSFSATDFPRFFEEAKPLARVILWGGQGDALGDNESAAHVAAGLAKAYGFTYAAQVSYRSDAPFDAARQEKALRDVVAFAEAREPAYLVLGVEVDRAYEEDRAYFDAFATWYGDAYDAVKNASPSTKVFPSFQLEHMAGRTGGLFGGAESSAPAWDLLDRFPRRDLTAFTTYPGLVFADPDDIPQGYYAAARDAARGPIAFTEVGHFAAMSAPGWESSPEEQRAFVERFLRDADEVDARLAIWLHLHDQPSLSLEPFRSMGLIAADGAHRPAHGAWANATSG